MDKDKTFKLPPLERTPTVVKLHFPIKVLLQEDFITRFFGFAFVVILVSALPEWGRHGLNFYVCEYVFSMSILILILFKTTLEYYFDYLNLWHIAFVELSIRKATAMGIDLSESEILETGFEAIEKATDDLTESIQKRYQHPINRKWVKIAKWVWYPFFVAILLCQFALLWLN